MGELNEVVVALLEAFSGGLAIIKTLRHRRKEAKAKIDTATQSEELRLRRSLKKNREDVRSVYSKDLEKLGSKFAEGDGMFKFIMSCLASFSSFTGGVIASGG
jgi:hypothetical protein